MTDTDDKPKRTKRVGPISKTLQKVREKRLLSGLSFAFADRLEFLNPEHWDRAAAFGSVFLSRDYLRALEAGGLSGATMRYGVIYRSQTPVACFATQTLDISGDQLVRSVDQLSDEDRSQLSIKRLTRKALERVHRRVTVCGNLVSWGMDGIAIDPDEPAAEIWKGLCEGLYRLRRANKLYGQTDYVIVKDLPQSVKADGSAFSIHGYRAVETEPNMVLTIDPTWKNLADYQASLNKKYRKAVRSVEQTLEKAGVTLSRLENLADRRDELHAMYKAVVARADVRLAELSADYLPGLQANLGADRFATLALQSTDGKLLGYVTVIRDRETAIGYYLGIDYGANEELPIYHRLLFAVIEQALEWKCSRISFGRTALEAKSRLGCHPEPSFVWVRHRVPLLNLVVKQLLKAVPHAEPPDRNPFKEG